MKGLILMSEDDWWLWGHRERWRWGQFGFNCGEFCPDAGWGTTQGAPVTLLVSPHCPPVTCPCHPMSPLCHVPPRVPCVTWLSPGCPSSAGVALLAGCEEERGGLRRQPGAAAVPGHAQRCHRGGTRGTGPALGHHQPPCLQGRGAGPAEIRGGAPLQVRGGFWGPPSPVWGFGDMPSPHLGTAVSPWGMAWLLVCSGQGKGWGSGRIWGVDGDFGVQRGVKEDLGV